MESLILTRHDSLKVILFPFPGGKDLIFYTTNNEKIIDHKTSTAPVDTVCYIYYDQPGNMDTLADTICKQLHEQFYPDGMICDTATFSKEKGFICIRFPEHININYDQITQEIASITGQQAFVFTPDQISSV